eukprot:6003234-Ditylum_brightwellii.AAC.1
MTALERSFAIAPVFMKYISNDVICGVKANIICADDDSCNTTHFDEYRTHVGEDKPMPGALDIGGKPVETSHLPSLTINTSDHPHFNESPKLFQVPLP